MFQCRDFKPSSLLRINLSRHNWFCGIILTKRSPLKLFWSGCFLDSGKLGWTFFTIFWHFIASQHSIVSDRADYVTSSKHQKWDYFLSSCSRVQEYTLKLNIKTALCGTVNVILKMVLDISVETEFKGGWHRGPFLNQYGPNIWKIWVLLACFGWYHWF